MISVWYDRLIPAGTDWQQQIDTELDDAQLIFLLVTKNFLNSEYCYHREMTTALQRHESGEARVIPILVVPCDWQSAPFARLQCVPADDKPVVEWGVPDRAWATVVSAIRKIALEWQGQPPRLEPDVVVMPEWKRVLDREVQTATARFQVEQMIKSGRPRATCLCWYGGPNDGLGHLHDRFLLELREVADNRICRVRPIWPAVKKQTWKAFTEMIADSLHVPGGDAPGQAIRIQELGQWIRQQFDGRREQEVLLVDHQVIEKESAFSPKELLEYLKWWDRMLEYLQENQHLVVAVSYVTDNGVYMQDRLDQVVEVHPFHQLRFCTLPVLHSLEPKELRSFLLRTKLRVDMSVGEREALITKVMKKTKGVYEAVVKFFERYFGETG